MVGDCRVYDSLAPLANILSSQLGFSDTQTGTIKPIAARRRLDRNVWSDLVRLDKSYCFVVGRCVMFHSVGCRLAVADAGDHDPDLRGRSLWSRRR